MQTASKSNVTDVLIGFSAFLIWGLSPAYWKMISGIGAFEIILHRILWSFFFLIPIVILQKRVSELKEILTCPKELFLLLFTALLVSFNWLIYIWAVNNGFILQASLGYYINPLMNVILGGLFLRERLRPLQFTAFLMALAGVIYLTVSYGKFPVIAITLAVSFGLYGLLRKTARAEALTGLLIETFMLSIPASFCLLYYHIKGTGAFLTIGWRMDLLLVGASLITALPLLLFNLAARRLLLSTVGFIQYTAPTAMFLLGVFVYHESFSTNQLITFAAIWGALILYSWDSYRMHQNLKKQD